MSFAAMATGPALLVIAAAVAAAVALFLLKIRPPQIAVPSLALWRRVLDENRERTWWERIRKAVSLAAVVLIALAIALAVLRPQRTSNPGPRTGSAPGTGDRGPRTSGSRVSIVIDSSWSMLAQTSSGATRWDRAVRRARALAAAAAGDDLVLSTTADGVVEGPTPDVALIEAALDRIAPSGGDAAAWPRVEGARVTYFLTDGAVARALEPGVLVESVFEPAANVAITAFDVRPGASLDSAGQAFLEVANYAATAQDVRIRLTRGGASVLDVSVNLPAGTAAGRVVPLDRAGDPRLRAHVSAKDDALVIDDDAVAWIDGAAPIAVTVVSDQPASYGPLLSQDPRVRATFVSPKNYAPGREDLVIFDRVLPAAPPRVPALFIAPPAEPALKTRSGLISGRVTPEMSPDLIFNLADVDLKTMAFDVARQYAPEGLTPIARSDDGAPLVYAHEEPDQRFVLFTFSVTDSKLMFAPGFPALMAGTIEWLAHPGQSGATGTRRPGPATLYGAIASLSGPDGKSVPLTTIGGVNVATLSRVGFYEARAGGATGVIAVNAGDPEISDLQRSRLPQAAGGASAPSRGRPWWLYAAALALALVAAEWFTWQRRITV